MQRAPPLAAPCSPPMDIRKIGDRNMASKARPHTNDNAIQVTRTGLLCRLDVYASCGELFLTQRISGATADEIREKMKQRSRWVDTYGAWNDKRYDPPVFFEPRVTDEVWRFATRGEVNKRAGRWGYALVRDGVMICEIVTAMS